MSALNELLDEIVDYAGLFPPAGLDLKTVVENYHRYQQSEARWMLARLIVPAGRLGELLETTRSLALVSPWHISALVPGIDAPDDALKKSIESIVDFNAVQEQFVVDAIEVKCPLAEHAAQIAALVPETIRAFLEVPHQDDPEQHLLAIKSTESAFAKIRTGGVTEDLIPSVDEVARFIYQCGQNNVGLKATAGLHHPVRNEFNLTYEADSPRGTMHGFLNVFVSTLFAFVGAEQELIKQILRSESINNFSFTAGQVQFGDHVIEMDQVREIRRNKAISFGSCSFEEPVSDLRALGFESEIQPAV